MNTWLMWCRFQVMRGTQTPAAFEAEVALAKATLSSLPGTHWREYLDAWKGPDA